MKALTYHGPHHVSVDNMPDPALEAADDIILRVTATAVTFRSASVPRKDPRHAPW